MRTNGKPFDNKQELSMYDAKMNEARQKRFDGAGVLMARSVI